LAAQRRLVRALVVLVLIAGLASCRSALREPPGLQELCQGTPAVGDEQADELCAEAAACFERRTHGDVARAAELWTRAAAGVPDRVEPLIEAVRARIWISEHTDDDAVRLQEIVAAVQTAQWCPRRAPDDPRCDYWLAATLGLQARERRSTALDALPKIVELFQRAAANDPMIEQGGPDRALALTYLRAPGWPTGPGDPDLGLEHAQRAVELSPDYPPNHLALGEAYDAIEDPEASREAYEQGLELARAMERGGDPDAGAWIETAEKALQ
jgi:tetratricopeptide (TPR) repeat protein